MRVEYWKRTSGGRTVYIDKSLPTSAIYGAIYEWISTHSSKEGALNCSMDMTRQGIENILWKRYRFEADVLIYPNSNWMWDIRVTKSFNPIDVTDKVIGVLKG